MASGSVPRRYLLAIALASMVITVIAVAWIDRPLALWIAAHDQSPWWDRIVKILEYPIGITPWTWTVPIVVVGGTLITLAVPSLRRQRHAWMYLAVVYLLTRNLTFFIKIFAGRYRPHQWVPIGGPTFGHVGTGQSFPSGHVTAFAGLIVPIVVAVPRLRPLLVLIPFIMVARMAVQAHFLSDTLAVLAFTSLVAWACGPILALGEPARR
jgi:membrane-associated phospholipid phosphatase